MSSNSLLLLLTFQSSYSLSQQRNYYSTTSRSSTARPSSTVIDNNKNATDINSTTTNNTNNGQLVSNTELYNKIASVIECGGNGRSNDNNIVAVIAYGSGVWVQEEQVVQPNQQQQQQQSNQQQQQVTTTILPTDDTNNTPNNNVIDYIICVKDIIEFHKNNIITNPDHYSDSLLVPSRNRAYKNNDEIAATAQRIAWFQRHTPPVLLFGQSYVTNPGLWFHIVPSVHIKYGVVQINDLCNDLYNWDYLYVAGRFQKPILWVYETEPDLRHYQEQYNIPAAFVTSLLLLFGHSLENDIRESNLQQQHNTTTDIELYQQIAGLSYRGDPRMIIGAEDPNKIVKLVTSTGQIDRFYNLYKPVIETFQQYGILSWYQHDRTTSSNNNNTKLLNDTFTWDSTNVRARDILWSYIPVPIQKQVERKQRQLYSTWYTTTNNHRIPTNNDLNVLLKLQALQSVITTIVAKSSRYQSLKGLVTAGFQTSFRYAYRKFRKGGRFTS